MPGVPSCVSAFPHLPGYPDTPGKEPRVTAEGGMLRQILYKGQDERHALSCVASVGALMSGRLLCIGAAKSICTEVRALTDRRDTPCDTQRTIIPFSDGKWEG